MKTLLEEIDDYLESVTLGRREAALERIIQGQKLSDMPIRIRINEEPKEDAPEEE